jgi:hypothetical protein
MDDQGKGKRQRLRIKDEGVRTKGNKKYNAKSTNNFRVLALLLMPCAFSLIFDLKFCSTPCAMPHTILSDTGKKIKLI